MNYTEAQDESTKDLYSNMSLGLTQGVDLDSKMSRVSDDIHENNAGSTAEFRAQQIGHELEDELPLTRMTPPQMDPNDNICADCLGLDLPGKLQRFFVDREPRITTLRHPYYVHEMHIANVGFKYRQQPKTACVLCSILFDSCNGSETCHEDGDAGDAIRLVEYLSYSGFVSVPWGVYDHKIHDSPSLVVVSQGCDLSYSGDTSFPRIRPFAQHHGAAVLLQDGNHPTMFVPQVVSSFFDAKVASDWLDHCKSNHSQLCGGLSCSPVTGLRLIDCKTLSIIEAEEGSQYVALSYVWGKTSNIDNAVRYISNKRLLPETPSSVITDAIKVTKVLGFQYLWVDKFCIDQDDSDMKKDQIKQMKAIYENADLTIVAAAGTDETYGLPGVGQRPRSPQRTAKLNGVQVICTMQDPQSSIRSSRWASRGWTFQEATLSRRRLVFTDQQLYFECNTISCFESIHSPLDSLYTEDVLSRATVRGGMFGRSTNGFGGNFGSLFPEKMDPFDLLCKYLAAIEDYSSRNLTNDEDSLDAFRGIIERYSRYPKHINAIWGLPYPADQQDRKSYFIYSLCWIHTESCWGSSRHPRRREEFPSWTWAGWAGAVQFAIEPGANPDVKYSGIYMIGLGNRDEISYGLGSLDASRPESNCRTLRLLAKPLPPNLFSCQPTGNGRMRWHFSQCSATLFFSRDGISEAQFAQEIVDIDRWRCIYVCSPSPHYSMVLEHNHDTETWTRAGMFCIEDEGEMSSLIMSIDPIWFDIE